MKISIICISCLTFLVILLAVNVLVSRIRTKTLYGYSALPEDVLYKAVRAHGNAIEYVPIVAIVIYILGLTSQPLWVVVCMALFVASRLVAAVGILSAKSLDQPNALRFIGTSVSIVTATGLASALLVEGLNA